MPTYVYQCSACDQTFEADQRITEAPLTSCACGSTGTVKRIIQPIAVMFKGSGFHINDYAPSTSQGKSESSSAESKAVESKVSESGSPSETKTESAPTPKPETTKESTPAPAPSP